MVSWWFTSYDSEQIINSATYTEMHTLDFTAPAEGDYLILVSACVHIDSTSLYVQTRVQLDDSVNIMETVNASVNSTDTSDYRNISSVYLAESLGSGSHYIDIDCIDGGGVLKGQIRYIKICVLRLDDWISGDYEYESTEGSSGDLYYGWGASSEVESLTFTPSEEADYLILGSCEIASESTSVSVSIRLNYDSGSEYLPVVNSEETETYVTYESQNLNEYHSVVWGGIITIPASSKTITMEARTNSSFIGDSRKRRIIALKLSSLSEDIETDEDPANTSTTDEWADKSSVTFTPGQTEDWLLLAGMIIKPDSTYYPAHTRFEHTTGTSTGTISQMNMDSHDSSDYACCMPLFTFEIKELGATSQVFKTQFGRTDSSVTARYGKGSWIVALPEPSSGSTNDVTLNSNARIKTEESITKTSNSRIKTEESITLNSNVRVVAQNDVTLNSNARIKAEVYITKTSNVRIKDDYDVSLNSNARIKTEEFITLNSNTRIKTEEYISKTSNVRIKDDYDITLNSNARIKITDSITLNSNAKIIVSGTNDITLNSNARIKSSGTKSLSSNSRIKITESVTLSSNSRIFKSNSTSLLSNCRIRLPSDIHWFQASIIEYYYLKGFVVEDYIKAIIEPIYYAFTITEKYYLKGVIEEKYHLKGVIE